MPRGTPVSYGKTRGTGGDGVYYVVYSYREERIGFLAAHLALRLVESLLPEKLRGIERIERLLPNELHIDRSAPFDFKNELDELINAAFDLALGPTTQSIVDEAARRGIPGLRLNDPKPHPAQLRQVSEAHRRSTTPLTSNIAVEVASDKELTIRVLGDVGVLVPQNVLTTSA